MKWIADMEAFQIGSKWYPKEIAILNTVTRECICLTTRCSIPYSMVYPNYLPTLKCQFAIHGLYWDQGDYSLHRANQIIVNKVKAGDEVYVNGDQKAKFFETWFPSSQVFEITNAPAIKDLKLCRNQVCNKNHQGMCARRKCFELLPYV